LAASIQFAVAQDNPVAVIHTLSYVSAGTPTFQLLTQSPTARSGSIWISSSNAGLTIKGEVDGPDPNWPATPAEMLSKDHVEVWLAAEPKVDLPPIGWVDRFGPTNLDTEKDCSSRLEEQPATQAGCKAWFKEQLKYRVQFQRLFARQWILAGDPAQTADSDSNHLIEVFANTAMREIETNSFPSQHSPAKLAPLVRDGVKMQVLSSRKDGQAYGFMITIPYSAFPPIPSLEIKDLWLMVDVFSAASEGKKMGVFSTTAPHRKWGDPATFNHVQIERPLHIKLSPCAYPLSRRDAMLTEQPSYVYPIPAVPNENDPVVVDQMVYLANGIAPSFDSAGVSPWAESQRFVSKPIGGGGFVCGPKLAYVKGSISVKTDDVIHSEGFDTKRLADGWTLVKTGPRADFNEFGWGGTCGGCPTAELNVYAFSPEGKKELALGIGDRVWDVETAAADIDFSPDWSHVMYYTKPSNPDDEGKGPVWSAKDYCLKGHAYETCGEEKNVAPPDPPKVPGLRMD